MARWTLTTAIVLALVIAGTPARAQQSTTYHLHNEASLITGTNKQLKTTGPDAPQAVLRTPNLRSNAGNAPRLIAYFETQAGVPGRAGAIHVGSTVMFTLRMRVTALPTSGNLYPYGIVRLNTASGQILCQAGGQISPVPALTTTLTWYTFSCTTTSAISLTPSDRFFLEVHAWLAGTVGNRNLYGELAIETGADSTVSVPNPAPNITSLTPDSGYVGQSITIAGAGFGATQGSNTVTFNGTAASVTSWSDTTIGTTVPSGATTGPVAVTVNGTPSNGVTFTITPRITSLTPSTGAFGQAVTVAGTSFGATQGSSAVTFNGAPASATSWSDTSIGTSVPSGATTGPVVLTVSGNASNGVAFTVLVPTIAALNPDAAAIGQTVTVSGTHFGAAQGASTVTFNGTPAAPAGWSDTSITVPVPVGTTTGPVVVTVGGVASNGLTFTLVTTGTVSGTITRASNGAALAGATVQAVLIGVVRGSATTAGDGTYAIPNLDPGTYDVRVLATGYSTEVRSGTVVAANATTGLDVAMLQPGSVSGRVTQSDGVTPIAGAAVTAYSGPVQNGSASTNETGDYTIGNLHPGGYTVQAASAGYRTLEQAATVSENATTTRNFSLEPAPSGPVQYAYDELGRLVQVTDPSGETAIYRYDAVGNILAIERPGTNVVAISSFTPNSGTIGTAVTIYGAGFSTTPGLNTVTFDGVAASVTSATPTQVATTVPAGATTGPIAVTTPAGSAASSTAFTVLANDGSPTITSFAPGTAAAGMALTVNGSNFDLVAANNNLRLNLSPAEVTSATAEALAATVPHAATTGRVSVTTQHGSAVSSEYLWVAPPPYAATDPSSTTAVEFGTATPVSVATANKIALLAFEGTVGHRASVNITGNSGGTSFIHLYDAFGRILRSSPVLDSAFLEPVELRSTATYSMVFDPYTTNPTTAMLAVYDVPADVTGSIVAGGDPVPVTTNTPGQNGRLTFAATSGQRVALGQDGYNCFTSTTTILTPDGSQQASTCGGTFIDTQNLDATGEYTILVDPKEANFGTTTLTLHSVPADANGAVAVNGTGFTLDMNAIGQNGFVTFSGTQGQQATVHISGNTVNGFLDVSLVQLLPGGGETVLVSTVGLATQFDLPTQTLPATGNYKVVVSPRGTATGSATVSVSNP